MTYLFFSQRSDYLELTTVALGVIRSITLELSYVLQPVGSSHFATRSSYLFLPASKKRNKNRVKILTEVSYFARIPFCLRQHSHVQTDERTREKLQRLSRQHTASIGCLDERRPTISRLESDSYAEGTKGGLSPRNVYELSDLT